MFLLKLQWELLGLKAPAFSWVVAIALISYSIYVYVKHKWESRRVAGLLHAAEVHLIALGDKESITPGQGISGALYESIGQVFRAIPIVRYIWQGIAASIEALL